MSHIRKLHIKVLERGLRFDPALTPNTECHDDGLKLAARFGQMILVEVGVAAAFAFRSTPASSSSFLKALRQQRRRHARHAAAQVIEARRTRNHLAQQHDGPPRAQNLGRHCDRTELLIATLCHRSHSLCNFDRRTLPRA